MSKSTKPKKRGRPFGTTRGRAVADVCTVRLDAEPKALLTQEFGSLGNALYFVARGIQLFRDKHGLAEVEATADVSNTDGMTFHDMTLCRDLLWHHVDQWRGAPGAIAPFVRALRRLEVALYGDQYYRDPPPLTNLVGATKRRVLPLGVDAQDVPTEAFKASGKDPHASHPTKGVTNPGKRHRACWHCGTTMNHAVDCPSAAMGPMFDPKETFARREKQLTAKAIARRARAEALAAEAAARTAAQEAIRAKFFPSTADAPAPDPLGGEEKGSMSCPPNFSPEKEET